MNDREKRRLIFEDTMDQYENDPVLQKAIEQSVRNTVFYPGDLDPQFLEEKESETKTTVSQKRTFEAAADLIARHPDKKVAVLNFASAWNPGGGVRYGAGAQEECLCRCSTLYPCLAAADLYEKYYGYNREHRDFKGSDAVIYTPGIVIIKTDTELPVRLAPEDYKRIDVMTCAAPNLNDDYMVVEQMDDEEWDRYWLKIYQKRIRNILYVAMDQKADILILGAWGCGAYGGDPEIVAKAFRNELDRKGSYFLAVEFAIYGTGRNYDAFEEVFSCLR